MVPTTDFTLGQHNEAIARISDVCERIEGKVDSLTATVAEQRGEKRALTVLAHGVSGLIGAIAAGATVFFGSRQ